MATTTVANCCRLQKPCEAAARGDDIGDDIKITCTGKIKEGDILLKKSGDYLLEDPPAFHFHCAKRHFDEEVWTALCKLS